ncbi:MAG: HAD hydrolase-like protein [Lachnospiraceae bacterium]|nr:HAD hydrolase-like protein [Lachnospiraceae bacterium]
MTDVFETYQKKKDYLVCIDSDGCVMDTMNIKHFQCFGPCMIREWGLELWQQPILTLWNEINLYTMTRGINRFAGLAITLKEVDRKYKKIEGLEALEHWVQSAEELSNKSLMRCMEEQDHAIFQKVLRWSEEVNREVNALPESGKLPFAGAKEALRVISQVADVAIVSSANQQAIMEEWEKYGLLDHTAIVLSQDAGTKAYCIKRLMEKGYADSHVLMVGDAPGDRDAAFSNGALYFPILVRREKESWNRLVEEGMYTFLGEIYAGAYQEKLIQEFEENLS